MYTTREAAATRHTVTPRPDLGYFLVLSGTSKAVYKVRPKGGSEATCNCRWFRERGTTCSHIIAVLTYAINVLEVAS